MAGIAVCVRLLCSGQGLLWCVVCVVGGWSCCVVGAWVGIAVWWVGVEAMMTVRSI